MIFEEKKANRPGNPTNKEEFLKWLDWHSQKENTYAWDFNFEFELNGHKIRACNLFSHIVIDNLTYDVRDYYCRYHIGTQEYKPTEYIMSKVYDE